MLARALLLAQQTWLLEPKTSRPVQGCCSFRAHVTVTSMVTETILGVVLANLLGTAASLPFLAGYDLFLQSYRTGPSRRPGVFCSTQ